jgi:hypothetical protein
VAERTKALKALMAWAKAEKPLGNSETLHPGCRGSDDFPWILPRSWGDFGLIQQKREDLLEQIQEN